MRRGREQRSVPLEGAADGGGGPVAEPPVERPRRLDVPAALRASTARARRRPRRCAGAAAAPVDDPERDRLRPARADPGLPRPRALVGRRHGRAAGRHLRGRSAGRTTSTGSRRASPASTRASARCSTRSSTACSCSPASIVCWHFELLPRWALALLAARELFMLVLVRCGLRHGVDLKVNWLGRAGRLAGHGRAVLRAWRASSGSADACLYIGLALVLASAGAVRARRAAAVSRARPST